MGGTQAARIYGEFMSSSKKALSSQSVRRRRIAGLSLVELMVAVAVMVVGFAGVFAVLGRIQRNAIINRAHTNAYNILRNVTDQAMQLGWATLENPGTPLDPAANPDYITGTTTDKPGPKDILKPTVLGWTSAYIPSPGEAGSLVAQNASVASDTNWKQWDMYSAQNAAGTVSNPVYQDYQNPANNVDARIYRKVQCVLNDRTLLWITFRIEYVIRGQRYAHNMCSLRAID